MRRFASADRRSPEHLSRFGTGKVLADAISGHLAGTPLSCLRLGAESDVPAALRGCARGLAARGVSETPPNPSNFTTRQKFAA